MAIITKPSEIAASIRETEEQKKALTELYDILYEAWLKDLPLQSEYEKNIVFLLKPLFEIRKKMGKKAIVHSENDSQREQE